MDRKTIALDSLIEMCEEFSLVEVGCGRGFGHYATFGNQVFDIALFIGRYFIIPGHWTSGFLALIAVAVFFVFTVPVGFDVGQVGLAVRHVYAWKHQVVLNESLGI